jgi:hypothetical protein
MWEGKKCGGICWKEEDEGRRNKEGSGQLI